MPPIDADDTIVEESSERKRKRKHKHERVESTADPVSTPGEEKQHKKKRKHKEMDSEIAKAEVSGPPESDKSRKKKVKSPPQDSIFPNPSEDKGLAESALKGQILMSITQIPPESMDFFSTRLRVYSGFVPF